MTEGSNFNKPSDGAREMGLTRRAPESSASFAFAESQTKAPGTDAFRVERADVLRAEKQKEDTLRKAISQKEARERRDVSPSAQREQQYLAIIKNLDKELGGMMDLAQNYRVLYGAEISEDTDEEKRHGFRDSFLGRFFTRSKEKKEARKKAEEQGLYGAWVFQNRWKELSEQLIEKAKKLPYNGDRAVLQENLHTFFKLPTRSAASVLWEALYKDFLDLTVLAPITAPFDIYKEIKKTGRNEERMRGEAMGRRTNDLADQVLENPGFHKTRQAIAEAYGKAVERLNAEDVLEYLYTTDQGQEILRLQQVQDEESQIVSRMDAPTKALYDKIQVAKQALRMFLKGDPKIRFFQINQTVREIIASMGRASVRGKEKRIFEQKIEELHAGIEKAYILGGRKDMLDETFRELQSTELVVEDLLQKSCMSEAQRSRAKQALQGKARGVLLYASKLLPTNTIPVPLDLSQRQIRDMIDALKNEVLLFCLAQAKFVVRQSMDGYIPVTSGIQKERELGKLNQVHKRIAFLIDGRTSPVAVVQREALRRERALLQKTNSLTSVHLEAGILFHFSELYQTLEGLKLGSETKDLTDLIDLVERLRIKLLALDPREEFVQSMIGDLLPWDCLLFGGYLGGDLGKTIVQETIVRTGDWKMALRELNKTKKAWLLGRKLTIHTDREYQPIMAKKQILRTLPEGYKEQAEYILQTLEGQRDQG